MPANARSVERTGKVASRVNRGSDQPYRHKGVEPSRDGRSGAFRQTDRLVVAVAVNAFPHLLTMDRDFRIDLEAELHPPAANLQHFHSEQAMKTISPADYDRFLNFP